MLPQVKKNEWNVNGASLGIDISNKGPNASAVPAEGLSMRWVRV